MGAQQKQGDSALESGSPWVRTPPKSHFPEAKEAGESTAEPWLLSVILLSSASHAECPGDSRSGQPQGQPFKGGQRWDPVPGTLLI